MAIELLDPQWIIARLKGQVAALKLVSGAADLARAIESLKQHPAAFVLPIAERAEPNALAAMAVSQRNETRFAVVLAVQNLRDARGETAHTDLRTLRTAVLGALLGWQPDADFDPCEFAGGALRPFDDQVLWWQDDYVTRAFLRSV